VVRLGFIIALLAVLGVALSAFAGYRSYDQELTVDRIALSRAIDVHASLVQERMSERELLARVASGLFRSPAKMTANMLEPLRSSIYAFKTDFVVASWMARVQPNEIDTARAVITEGGYPDPRIRNSDNSPRDTAQLTRPITVVLDVEPRNADTMTLPGRTFDQHNAVGVALERALTESRPIATDPMQLRTNGALGVLLVSPVQKSDNETVGFVTFSYAIAPFMLTNDDLSLFTVIVKDPRNPGKELAVNEQGATVARDSKTGAAAPIVRTVNFGAHDWTLGYYAKVDSHERALQLGVLVALAGLAITSILCGLFGYVVYSNVRLRREIDMRIGFERRLTAVIDELNHRVKNILAVIQSIVTRTLRHGADVDVARDLLIGRIHAMSNVVSLLSESQWQGVPLKGLFEPRAIPHTDRISVQGPDITVSARAAQSLSLLFFELASHSDEGLSLAGKHPKVVAQWTVTGTGRDAIFHFKWEEFNMTEKTRKPDSDFGVVLLERVAPEALGGKAKRYFTDVSYVYELTAPMETVIDLTERDRTDRISMPVR
jgi:two-component sensor histidine kinase